jgi:hypothetical protein
MVVQFDLFISCLCIWISLQPVLTNQVAFFFIFFLNNVKSGYDKQISFLPEQWKFVMGRSTLLVRGMED